jgi:hypothetical protein
MTYKTKEAFYFRQQRIAQRLKKLPILLLSFYTETKRQFFEAAAIVMINL